MRETKLKVFYLFHSLNFDSRERVESQGLAKISHILPVLQEGHAGLVSFFSLCCSGGTAEILRTGGCVAPSKQRYDRIMY